MEGVTILQTEQFDKLVHLLEDLHREVMDLKKEREQNLSPHLRTNEVCKMTGMSRTWVIRNKYNLGCSKQNGTLWFDRATINDFIKTNHFKKITDSLGMLA